jgi:hypothetical protein
MAEVIRLTFEEPPPADVAHWTVRDMAAGERRITGQGFHWIWKTAGLAPHRCWLFTPTSASWLNQVERFFALLTDRALKRGVFRSVRELEQAIDIYIEDA